MQQPDTFRKFVRRKKSPYSDQQRINLAKKGQALPDGSFPIKTRQDLANAISSYGRAKSKRIAKAHIIKRAKAMRLTKLLPINWKKYL
jgi:hypothetical protein